MQEQQEPVPIHIRIDTQEQRSGISDLLASMPQVSRNLTEKIMTYALGRGVQPYDNRALDKINQALAADGYHFQTLIYEVVRSLPFQSRRGDGSRNNSLIAKETGK